MSTIRGLMRKFKALDTDKIAVESIEVTKEIFADLNVEQMNKGLRSDGSEILPSYTDFTIDIKKMKGQPFDRVTLRDTGLFQEGLHTTVIGDRIVTTSTDPKTDKLNKKYSKSKGSIFGLNRISKAEYMRDLRPTFIHKIKEALKR